MSLTEILYRWVETRRVRSRRWSKCLIPAAVEWLEPRALLSGGPAQFVEPDPGYLHQFGATVTVLTNGNVVITSPGDGAGGALAGAVYLYNGQTGALISTITGANEGDGIGSGGVTALSNGNFVIDSPGWNGGLGAVTLGNGTTGVSGVVSAANSLVGSTAGDSVGNTANNIVTIPAIIALSNGNYVVDSPNWNQNRGAVTFGSGTTGVHGVISATNSLVGLTAGANGDFVGNYGVTALNNGNYVVNSQNWNTPSATYAGAVTWGSGTSGVKGVINTGNSLVGLRRSTSTPGPVFAPSVTALTNGNFVVDSPYWNNSLGAVTWGNGTTGLAGIISATNSLIGSTTGDSVGLYWQLTGSTSGVTALSNGNYVVDSYEWHNGAMFFAGAVTWGSGTAGVKGTISAANSLIGANTYDGIGEGHVFALKNGNYVVDSPWWNGSSGAVTLCDGMAGRTGTVTSTNSLVGGNGGPADEVGYSGITELTNGNFVVDSNTWSHSLGAVTWVNGTTGLTGFVSPANSFVGSSVCNEAGSVGITALTNGNYVIDSQANYLVGTNRDVPGAVTLANGFTGLTGSISAANSLVGNWVGSGGVAALSNGNYVVDSYWWNNGTIRLAGAITFANGTTGVTGSVSSANSLVGSHTSDSVGAAGIIALANGNYLVKSPGWNSDVPTGRGAVTWGNGTTGVAGIVSATNSLVGTASHNDGSVSVLSDGNYVVSYFSDNLFGVGTVGLRGNAVDINAFHGQFILDPVHGAAYLANPYDAANASGEVFRGTSAIGLLISLNVTTGSSSIAVSDYASQFTNAATPQGHLLSPGSSGAVPLNLGTTSLGTPLTQTITVTNNGTNPLIVQPISAPAGFSILNNFTANQSIASGNSASFTLQLNAVTVGTATGVVTINSNAPVNGVFSFNITGTVAVPKIVVNQGSTTLTNGVSTVTLPATLVGAPVTQVITVTNNSNAPLAVTSVTAPPGFSISNDTTTHGAIAAHASAHFTLQLDAMAIGTPNGVVTIASNDPTASLFTFNVAGTVSAPKITVQQGSVALASGISSVSLGSTPVGTPVTRVITVANHGNAALVVQPVSAPAGFSIFPGTNFTANQQIPAGSSASFTVQLDAASVGVLTGLVTISSNDTTVGSFTFNVTGIATPTVSSVPLLHLRQGTTTLANGAGPVIFNSVPAGTAVTQIFMLTNEGTGPLVVQPVTVPSGFSVLSNFVANQSIAAGASTSFQIQLNANASGTPAGSVTFSTNDLLAQPFTFRIAANYPPTNITLGNGSGVVAVNPNQAQLVGVLKTIDADSSTVPQTYSYSSSSATLNGTSTNSPFTIDGSGDLSVAAGAMVGVYSVSIMSTDSQGLSLTPPKSFTIFVTGASTTPIASSQTVASGTPGNFILDTFPTTITTTHDAPGDPSVNVHVGSLEHVINQVTYRLATGGDNAYFTIDSSGHLQTTAALNSAVKGTYQISIITTDTVTGTSTVHPYTIKVAAVVKHTIAVTPATLTTAEASANGTIVGTVLATDTGGHAPNYSIIGGNTGGGFAINRLTGQITVANSAVLIQATNPTFALTVQVTDSGVSASATITINLAKIVLSNSSVAKGTSIGTTIGQFGTAEAGTGNTFTYKFVAGTNDNASFTLDSTGQLKSKVPFNAAIKSTYLVVVSSTDQHGFSLSNSFVISVLGPSDITLSNSSVAATATIGTVIGQFTTTANGTGNTFTYRLPSVDYDDADFTVDATGHLKLNTVLNAAIKKSYTLIVISTDQRGVAMGKTFTITVK